MSSIQQQEENDEENLINRIYTKLAENSEARAKNREGDSLDMSMDVQER